MIAVLADVHGNLPALRAVLDEAERLGCDRLISLGDVTGYYAEPHLCIELLAERGALQLLGNHDSYLTSGTGCPRSRLVSTLMEHQRRVVGPAHLALLAGLAPSHEEGRLSFVHGGWEDPLDEYLYRVGRATLKGDAQVYFSGHTHVQRSIDFGDKFYCNPGSVGQPRDGDPRAAFAVFDGKRARLVRVPYDVEKTAAAMRRAGYTDERLWANLAGGTQIGGRIDRIVAEHEPL